MHGLNKRAVHLSHRLLWGYWEKVSPVAWGWGRGGRVVSTPGAVLRRGEVSQGAFWLLLVSFHEVSKECGLIWAGGLVGCSGDIKALLGG